MIHAWSTMWSPGLCDSPRHATYDIQHRPDVIGAEPRYQPSGRRPVMTNTPMISPVWTVEAVRALGVTTDVPTAAAILGIGRTKAYELARQGEFPVPILRIGRRILIPTPSLLALVGAQP
jgi:hypothetical protein